MDEKNSGGRPAGAARGGERRQEFRRLLLEQNLRVLAIECLRAICPTGITVDIPRSNIGDSIHVRDIKLPGGGDRKSAAGSDRVFGGGAVVEEEPVGR